MTATAPDRDALDRVIGACLHCGLCLPACPTYELTTDERSSPRGRIRLIRSVLDGSLEAGRVFSDEMQFCLDCRACETACPAGVRYGELVSWARTRSAELGLEPAGVRVRRWLILRVVLRSAPTFAFFARLLRAWRRCGLRDVVGRDELDGLLPPPLRRALRALRSLPDVADAPYLRSSPETVPAAMTGAAGKGTAALLTGCVMNHAFPDVHRHTAELLSRQGYDVTVPRGQFCCGALHAHNGDPRHAKKLASDLLRAFPSGAATVVANSAGCGAFLRQYGALFSDDRELSGRAAAFSASVRDVTELIGVAPREAAGSEDGGRIRVTYHDPCHLAHGQGITREPRALIAGVPGVEFVELRNASRCCGSAGIYSLLRPDDSDELLRRKIEAIIATGASVVATGNPGCHLQIERGLREAGSAVKVVHPVTLAACGARSAEVPGP